MSDKLRYDNEAEEFRKNFKEYKNSNIVLYGIGMITMALLERVKDFNIIGLLDRDETLVGKTMYGIKILSRQEVEEKADLVIINTVECYWSIIYERIQDWNIPVFTKDGKMATSNTIVEEENSEYWTKNSVELENEINRNDIISFDIFDTLIMRKIYNAEDVFKLIEQKLSKEFGEEFTYIGFRKQAVELLKEATIDDIFIKLQELTKWDEQKVMRIKECEIELDLHLMAPRREMVKICNKALEEKDVYFVSDTYYPTEILFKILKQNGICIDSKEKIIATCEYKLSKQQGMLWEFYNKEIVCDKRALHIGTDVKTDVELPQKYGINTYMIFSASQMLQSSSLRKIVPQIETIYSSLHVGMVLEKIFNNPFALHGTKGKVSFENNELAGYCLLGGVVYTYIIWLIKNAVEDNIEQLVFLGRDGYFLIRAYSHICNLLYIDFPKAVYLEASRRSVIIPAIESKEDIIKEIKREKYIGNIREYLFNRFGIEICEEDDTQIDITEYGETIIEKYTDQILSRASEERKEYLKYLESLGIKKNFAIVDTGHFGTIQYMLGKILRKQFVGYYFHADLSDDNKKYKNNMKVCFQKQNDKKGKEVQLYKNFRFIEAFFTAPYGMLLCIDCKGEKVYDKKMKNQKYFDIRLEMFQGILAFISDMVEIENDVNMGCNNDNIFVDELFGHFLNNGFVITDEMREKFYYDETMQIRKEVPLWK